MGQLTLDQRYQIQAGFDNGMSITEVGLSIGRHKSVISREVKRNSDLRNAQSKADLAHRKAINRHKEKAKKVSFTNSICDFVEPALCIGTS